MKKPKQPRKKPKKLRKNPKMHMKKHGNQCNL